jgi:hypothetical protein
MDQPRSTAESSSITCARRSDNPLAVIGLAFGLTAASSLALAAALGLPSAATTALAAYIVAIAEIVVITEALSPGRAVTERNVLIAQSGLLAISCGIWAWRRPRVARPELGALFRAVKSSPPLTSLRWAWERRPTTGIR